MFLIFKADEETYKADSLPLSFYPLASGSPLSSVFLFFGQKHLTANPKPELKKQSREGVLLSHMVALNLVLT